MLNFQCKESKEFFTLQEIKKMLEVKTVSSKGQITIPKEIRKSLNLKGGSKVAFVSDGHGNYSILNASQIALRNIQRVFEGVADELGLKGEDDIVAFIKENREK